MILKKGEKIHCPECDHLQDYTVDEYVVPGTKVPRSLRTHRCGYCDQKFSVQFFGKDEYEVLAEEDDGNEADDEIFQ